MTIGDMIEKVRLAFGGVSKDEQELAKLKEDLLKQQDVRVTQRKKKDALDRLIKDKQAELKVTALKQNQISLAKEIMKLKGDLDEIQTTENEISQVIDGLNMMVHEKEREINDKKSRTLVNSDKIEIATGKREDRLADRAELDKSMKRHSSVGSKSTESTEDIDALLAAAMSSDSVPVKPVETKVDPEVEAIIAAAAAPTSSTPTSDHPGVAVPN